MPMNMLQNDLSMYQSNGYCFPLEILSQAEARTFRAALEKDEITHGQIFHDTYRHSPHLLTSWASKLVHNKKLLDVVETILGPDIMCWDSTVFAKPANSIGYISWHQDITYWGLDSDDVCTAWIAFSPSTEASGCMQVIPATHTLDVVPHRDTYAEQNMLSRGQEVAVEVDESKAVNIVLEPGQASLHHVKIFHGSKPNRSDDRRIGFAVRYMKPSTSQSFGVQDAATLVRGHDRHGNFEQARRPHSDYAPDVIAYHADLQQRRQEVLMRQS